MDACQSEVPVRSRRLPFLVSATALAGLLVLPADVLAQRRWHGHGRSRVVVGYYPYYSPYYWHSFYSPFWSPWYWPPVYGYGYYRSYASELRIMATPREAEVYVDGYLVGTVDDFDGWSQRLRIQPGEHEIELFLEGYRSVRQKMLFRPGETYKIRAALGKSEPSDPPAMRPAPAPGATAGEPASPQVERERVRPPARHADARGFGTLAIRVQPADAVILVDGERWDRPEGEARLSLDLAPGAHEVEVRRDGHRTYRTTIEVKPGEITAVNVSLPAN
jgi:hypothetical protein